MYFVKILFCVTLFKASLGDKKDPKCYSKFDWEEKLLEKTIKTEIMMQEYMTSVNTALDNIAALKEEFKEIKTSVDTAMDDDSGVIKRQNQHLTDSMNQPTIAFNVKDAQNLSPANNERITFKKTLLNVGGAYDEVTGIFTSPINGTYIFSVQVSTYSSRWGVFQLVCDTVTNVILSIANYNNNAHYTTTSGTVVQLLTKGQKVWIIFRYLHSGSIQTLYEHPSYASNQFSGMLVHRTAN